MSSNKTIEKLCAMTRILESMEISDDSNKSKVSQLLSIINELTCLSSTQEKPDSALISVIDQMASQSLFKDANSITIAKHLDYLFSLDNIRPILLSKWSEFNPNISGYTRWLADIGFCAESITVLHVRSLLARHVEFNALACYYFNSDRTYKFETKSAALLGLIDHQVSKINGMLKLTTEHKQFVWCKIIEHNPQADYYSWKLIWDKYPGEYFYTQFLLYLEKEYMLETPKIIKY